MKTERLIGILSVLLQKEKTTAPELAEMFEVSRRTISRDIDALCVAGIPIMTEQGYNGGISIMEGYRMDRTVLTNDDMKAILAGLRSLDSVSGTNRYAQLMEKLSAGSSVLKGDEHILIDLAAWNRSAVSPKIELLHRNIREKKKTSFRYASPTGDTERTIEPYDLIFKWNAWYVWGWCGLRNDFRLFKLSRMTDIRTGEAFTGREVPFPDLSNERIFPVKYQVKALIQPQYRWRILEEFSAEHFREQEDGTLLFEAGFSDAENVISWALSFRDGIELLEPAGIRELFIETVDKVREKYKQT